jgi:hypothetical protein
MSGSHKKRHDKATESDEAAAARPTALGRRSRIASRRAISVS